MIWVNRFQAWIIFGAATGECEMRGAVGTAFVSPRVAVGDPGFWRRWLEEKNYEWCGDDDHYQGCYELLLSVMGFRGKSPHFASVHHTFDGLDL